MRHQRLIPVGRGILASLALLLVFATPWDVIAHPGRLPLPLRIGLFLAPGAVFAWYWLLAAGRVGTRQTAAAVGGYALLTLVAVWLVPYQPGDTQGVLVLAALMAAGNLGLRAGVLACLGLFALQVAIDVRGAPTALGIVREVLLFPLAWCITAGARLLLRSQRELAAAREEIARGAARAAVAEERVRFARDLHDLLGRNLAVIALRSEALARAEPGEKVRAEIGEIAGAARRGLEEVQRAVGGYRHRDLEAELNAACGALQAAGIACELQHDAGELTPMVEEVLAWTVREAVTNVIRHSRARRCRISVQRRPSAIALEVSDDGACGDAHPAPGNGLAGMRERAARIGGDVAAGRCDSGFRVSLRVPVEAAAPV